MAELSHEGKGIVRRTQDFRYVVLMIIKGLFRRYERWNPVHPTYGAFWGMGFGVGCGVGWGPGFGPEVIGYVGAGCGVGFSVGVTLAGVGIGFPANSLLEVPYNAMMATRTGASHLLRSDGWNSIAHRVSGLQKETGRRLSSFIPKHLLDKQVGLFDFNGHTRALQEAFGRLNGNIFGPNKGINETVLSSSIAAVFFAASVVAGVMWRFHHYSNQIYVPTHYQLGLSTIFNLISITPQQQRNIDYMSAGMRAEAQLQQGFYSRSCPQAEKIVKDFVNEHIPNAPSLAAALIRMHFHDCFVQGCDASLLLNSTSEGTNTEKLSPPNLTVRGYDFIDRIKALLEAACPRTVSCADIVALATRDSIVATGGPFWRVPTGRRDGSISRNAEALANIPAPFHNITVLESRFASKGLNMKDLVLLSGAHTIGVAHCNSFADRRLLNFSGVLGAVDPTMDSEYAENLKTRKCPNFNDNVTKVEMDPGSRTTFDLSYYSLLLKRRGLFESDHALTVNSTSLTIVNQLLQGSLQNFFGEFALSMEKMGLIGVKTGTNGEIRTNCARVN